MPRKKNQRPKRVNRRIKQKKQQCGWRWYHKFLLVMVSLAALLGLAYYLLSTYSNQPFRQIIIKSDGHAISIDKVRPVVKRHLTGGFFTLHTHPLQAELKTWPWVKAVSIRRIWPDQLQVVLEERQALALWNQQQLLSAEGVLFQPMKSSFPKALPALNGPANEEEKVLKMYREAVKWMQPFGLNVAGLKLMRHIWLLRLDSGTQIYFNELEKEQRAIFNRLYRQALHGKMDRVERIDLRYIGGASVHWRNKRN